MWTQFKNQVTKLYIQHDPNLDADRREEREGEKEGNKGFAFWLIENRKHMCPQFTEVNLNYAKE